jgi:hypothetical protein
MYPWMLQRENGKTWTRMEDSGSRYWKQPVRTLFSPTDFNKFSFLDRHEEKFPMSSALRVENSIAGDAFKCMIA